MDYESGVLIAFLIWCFGLIAMLIKVNSQMNKNLQKIGFRLSWVSLNPKPMSEFDTNKPIWRIILKFLVIAFFGFLFIFLSWVQVVFFIGMLGYKFFQDIGAPQVVRDFRWKLKNLNMTMDQVIEEFMKVDEVKLDFEIYKSNIINDMKQRNLI
jgi:hypothetical protein